MIFVYIPLIVFFAIIALLLIRKYTSLEFVEHAHLLWKTWSIRLAAMAATVEAVGADTPKWLLDAWDGLPGDVKSTLSPDTMHWISGVLIVASILSQPIRQQKLKDRVDEMRGQQ